MKPAGAFLRLGSITVSTYLIDALAYFVPSANIIVVVKGSRLDFIAEFNL
jgi:hypothetical protein